MPPPHPRPPGPEADQGHWDCVECGGPRKALSSLRNHLGVQTPSCVSQGRTQGWDGICSSSLPSRGCQAMEESASPAWLSRLFPLMYLAGP